MLVKYPDPQKYSGELKKFWKNFPKLNLFRVLSHSEPVVLGVSDLGKKVIYDLSIPEIIREMIITRVGFLRKADYQTEHHIELLRELNVIPKKISMISSVTIDFSIFNSKETLALKIADRIVNQESFIDLESELNEYFTEKEIVEMIFTASYYMMISSLINAIGLDSDSAKITLKSTMFKT